VFFEISLPWIQAHGLLLVRCLGTVAVMPLLGGRFVPKRAKLLIGLLLALLLAPTLPSAGGLLPAGDWPLLAGRMAVEMLFGLLLGFVAQLPIWAAQFAGQLIGFQMGFGIVSVLDPDAGGQQSLIAGLQQQVALLLFLVLDGHHMVLGALARSLELLPPGAVQLSPQLLDSGISLSAELLRVGLQLGAPVLAALFLSEVGLGVIARTVPQMNIFIVGFPLKIGVGLVMLALALPGFALLFSNRLDALAQTLLSLTGVAAP
jgi:flagellar biosynthesis protein FliR